MTLLEEALAEPGACAVEGDHFRGWWNYWGELERVVDECGATRLYGFENESDRTNWQASIPELGAVFGYVAEGGAYVTDGVVSWYLRAGQWFSLADGCHVELRDDVAGGTCRVIVSQREGFRGVRAAGGPVEELGRLRYIDGCSDSLLACPPVKGDPCLNHLHFPDGIIQTEHWHPSTRAGTVARGVGWCETPAGLTPLVPGMAFHIPTGGLHRFITEAAPMDVIAYHPDTDWGPTDEDHPMVNRTWIGEGRKIDNSGGAHAAAAIEERWLRAGMVN